MTERTPTAEALEKAREIVEAWLEEGDGGFGYGELRRRVAMALDEFAARKDADIC